MRECLFEWSATESIQTNPQWSSITLTAKCLKHYSFLLDQNLKYTKQHKFTIKHNVIFMDCVQIKQFLFWIDTPDQRLEFGKAHEETRSSRLNMCSLT